MIEPANFGTEEAKYWIQIVPSSAVFIPECHRSLEPDGEADSVSCWPE